LTLHTIDNTYHSHHVPVSRAERLTYSIEAKETYHRGKRDLHHIPVPRAERLTCSTAGHLRGQ